MCYSVGAKCAHGNGAIMTVPPLGLAAERLLHTTEVDSISREFTDPRMASKDITIIVDDDRLRICGAPEDVAARKMPVVVEVTTPTGPRTKSFEWLADAIIVALYLLDRPSWSGAKAKYVRNAMGLSMHELAYVLGEPDQQLVVARERGEISFSADQIRKLKALIAGAMPLEFRDRVRSMAMRATHGDGERLMFWT